MVLPQKSNFSSGNDTEIPRRIASGTLAQEGGAGALQKGHQNQAPHGIGPIHAPKNVVRVHQEMGGEKTKISFFYPFYMFGT